MDSNSSSNSKLTPAYLNSRFKTDIVGLSREWLKLVEVTGDAISLLENLKDDESHSPKLSSEVDQYILFLEQKFRTYQRMCEKEEKTPEIKVFLEKFLTPDRLKPLGVEFKEEIIKPGEEVTGEKRKQLGKNIKPLEIKSLDSNGDIQIFARSFPFYTCEDLGGYTYVDAPVITYKNVTESEQQFIQAIVEELSKKGESDQTEFSRRLEMLIDTPNFDLEGLHDFLLSLSDKQRRQFEDEVWTDLGRLELPEELRKSRLAILSQLEQHEIRVPSSYFENLCRLLQQSYYDKLIFDPGVQDGFVEATEEDVTCFIESGAERYPALEHLYLDESLYAVNQKLRELNQSGRPASGQENETLQMNLKDFQDRYLKRRYRKDLTELQAGIDISRFIEAKMALGNDLNRLLEKYAELLRELNPQHELLSSLESDTNTPNDETDSSRVPVTPEGTNFDENPPPIEEIIPPRIGTQPSQSEAVEEWLVNVVNRLESVTTEIIGALQQREEENKGLKEDNENLLRNLHDIHEQIKPLQTELDDRLNKVSFQIDKQVEWNKVAFQIGNARNKLNQFVSPKGKKSQGVGAIVSEVQNSHKEAEISYHEFKEKHASDSVLDTALRDIEAQIKRLEPEKDLTSRHRFPTFVTVPRLIYTLAIFGIGILIGYFALPDAPSVTETQNTETPVTESPEQSAQMTVGQLIEKVQLEISAEPNPTNKGYSIQIRLPNLGQINAAYIGRLKADETIAAGYMKEPPQLQERKNLRFIFKDDFYELDVKESGLSGGFVWLSWIQGISNEITNQNGVETRQTVIQIEYQGKDPLIIPKEFKIYTQTDQ